MPTCLTYESSVYSAKWSLVLNRLRGGRLQTMGGTEAEITFPRIHTWRTPVEVDTWQTGTDSGRPGYRAKAFDRSWPHLWRPGMLAHRTIEWRHIIGGHKTLHYQASLWAGYRLRWRGSRASRRPSPSRLQPSTTSVIAIPGYIISCGA